VSGVLTSSLFGRSQGKIIETSFKGKTDLHQLFQNAVTQPERIHKSKVSKVKLKLTQVQRQYSIPLNLWVICMVMFLCIVAPKGKFMLRFLFLKCLFRLLMYKGLNIINKRSLYI